MSMTLMASTTEFSIQDTTCYDATYSSTGQRPHWSLSLPRAL